MTAAPTQSRSRQARFRDHVGIAQQTWDDDTVLLNLPQDQKFTQRHAAAGLLVFGETGSGKTSGPGRTLALKCLRAGYGVLVLCAKEEEALDWIKYARDARRSRDVVRIEVGGDFRCDFLLNEMRQYGSSTLSMLGTFKNATAILRQGGGGGAENDQFWQSSSDDFMKNIIDLFKFSHLVAWEICKLDEEDKTTPPTFGPDEWLPPTNVPCILALLNLMQTAPSHQEEYDEKGRFFVECRKVAEKVAEILSDKNNKYGDRISVFSRTSPEEIKELWRLVENYWKREWASALSGASGDNKTHDSIRAYAKSTIALLERDKIANLFRRVKTEDGRYVDTVTPEQLGEGKIIIVDVPILRWAESGKLASCIWKYTAQRFVERRAKTRNDRLEALEQEYASHLEEAQQEVDDIKARGLSVWRPWDGAALKKAEKKLNDLKREHGQKEKEIKDSVRPVVIWADECQNFVTPLDSTYQATARSNRGITVFLTQSSDSLDKEMGGGAAAEKARNVLIANLTTKMFCANTNPPTNHMAAEMIGQTVKTLTSSGCNRARPWSLVGGVSTGKNQQINYDVMPEVFTKLKKGGPPDFQVECILLGNEVFPDGRKWMRITFDQMFQ